MSRDVRLLTARAVFDPRAWMKRWTPAAVPQPFAPHHARLVELPEPGHAQLRVVWRGSAKTTITRGLVAWLCERRKVRGILWVRANGSDCKDDREAIARVCDQRGIPYDVDGSLQRIVVNHVPIWTRTPGGAVRGLNWTNPDSGEVVRPDLCVIDDLETRETARSKTQTELIETWLFSDALQTGELAHPMRTIMNGTPITPNCLIAKAMRREPPFDRWDPPLVVPIVDRDTGRPNWPQMYDPTLRDRVPAITMATEYDLEALPAGRLYFPPAQTRWVDTPDHVSVWVGVDPAGDGDDATGIGAVTLDHDIGLHVVDAMAWDGLASQMPLQVAAFVRRQQEAGHHVAGVLFEANQGAWQWPARETRDLLDPITVQTEPPRLSKGERAIPVTLWQQNGWLSLAPHLAGSVLDAQLHTFTLDEQTVSGHDDVFDAVMWAAGVATRGHTVKPPAPRVDQVA